jgi:fused signal recognition particle receptor
MSELEKVRRVVARELPGARIEALLVLDATVGQNAVAQAREFLKFSGLSGIFLTKIDGTAKGGAAVAVVAELGLPIRYLGLGESEDDLADFSPREFVEALLS